MSRNARFAPTLTEISISLSSALPADTPSASPAPGSISPANYKSSKQSTVSTQDAKNGSKKTPKYSNKN
jgi:hypothetical protein